MKIVKDRIIKYTLITPTLLNISHVFKNDGIYLRGRVK
jgi:hypothetical protein